MTRNYGVKRHQFQPVTVRMRLGDAFAVFDSWPGRLMIAGIVIAGLLLMASCAHAGPRHHRHHHRYPIDPNGNRAEIVAHPSGCPARLFCGCGASVRIFGHPVRDLFLASNWRRFPSASPAPGMAAWRSGHVFVIEQVNGDGTVLAYDANSGGHLTRIHTVSLRGYHVVNPHGGKVAMVP